MPSQLLGNDPNASSILGCHPTSTSPTGERLIRCDYLTMVCAGWTLWLQPFNYWFYRTWTSPAYFWGDALERCEIGWERSALLPILINSHCSPNNIFLISLNYKKKSVKLLPGHLELLMRLTMTLSIAKIWFDWKATLKSLTTSQCEVYEPAGETLNMQGINLDARKIVEPAKESHLHWTVANSVFSFYSIFN